MMSEDAGYIPLLISLTGAEGEVEEFVELALAQLPRHECVVEDVTAVRNLVLRARAVRIRLFRDTLLDASNCISIAILCSIILDRRGVSTVIGRPVSIYRFFHCVLIIPELEGNGVVSITGRKRVDTAIPLSPKSVILRQRLARQLHNAHLRNLVHYWRNGSAGATQAKSDDSNGLASSPVKNSSRPRLRSWSLRQSGESTN